MSPRRQRLRQQEQSSAKKKQPPFIGENPYRVPGFEKENCVPLKKDALRYRFSWKDKKLKDLDLPSITSACISKRPTSLPSLFVKS